MILLNAIILFLTLFTGHPDLENILIANQWKVESHSSYKAKTFPSWTDVPLKSYNSPPECGQIVSFLKNHICSGQTNGFGLWGTIDQYKWSVDNAGNLFLEKILPTITLRQTLNVHSVNDKEIVFYTNPSIGIETGIYYTTVYRLKKI